MNTKETMGAVGARELEPPQPLVVILEVLAHLIRPRLEPLVLTPAVANRSQPRGPKEIQVLDAMALVAGNRTAFSR